MTTSEMTHKMRDCRGFIAALDQSGESTPKTLKTRFTRRRRKGGGLLRLRARIRL
jgi:fructose-bisphosphate aldolase class 1